MAHYDIFRDQLGIKYPAFGHALWEPNPARLYSPVEVGDVGFIREGKFHRLFNALLPADHPSHQRFGVPEYHEPLQPSVEDHIDKGIMSPNDFYSYGVTVASGGLDVFAREPVGSADVSFLCSRKCGAVLSLPVTAQREDTIARGDFAKWITRHIDTWFAFTRRLGLGIDQMEDIVLVTGRHRTRSWTNIAFYEGQSRAQASFGVRVIDGVSASINWQVSRRHIQGAMLSQGPSGGDLPEDQCIFVRGFRVARAFKLFPRIRGAAGHTQDPDQHDAQPDLEVVSMPSFTKYRDPLYVLLEYIAERAPNCDLVLVHDDDLDRLRKIGDGTSLETLQPDAVVGCLQRSEPEISQVACGEHLSESLSSDKNIPRTNTLGSMVAVFSEELSSWGGPFCTSQRPERLSPDSTTPSSPVPVSPSIFLQISVPDRSITSSTTPAPSCRSQNTPATPPWLFSSQNSYHLPFISSHHHSSLSEYDPEQDTQPPALAQDYQHWIDPSYPQSQLVYSNTPTYPPQPSVSDSRTQSQMQSQAPRHTNRYQFVASHQAPPPPPPSDVTQFSIHPFDSRYAFTQRRPRVASNLTLQSSVEFSQPPPLADNTAYYQYSSPAPAEYLTQAPWVALTTASDGTLQSRQSISPAWTNNQPLPPHGPKQEGERTQGKAKQRKRQKFETDTNDDDDVVYASSGVNMPRRSPGACIHCKRLKIKCMFPPGENVCKCCKTGEHNCIVEGRKKPRSAPNNLEYLLAETKQRDTVIESLLKQFHKPYLPTPISIEAYRMSSPSSDHHRKTAIEWLDRFQSSVPSPPVRSGYVKNPFDIHGDESEESDDGQTQQLQQHHVQPRRRSPGLNDSPHILVGPNTLVESDIDAYADDAVPIGLLANLAISTSNDVPAISAEQKSGRSADDDDVGVANREFFMPGPSFNLALRKSLIDKISLPDILVHNLVTPHDVEKLFDIFYTRINPFISLLEPKLHTPAVTLSRCPFLFTVVCAIALRYSDKPEVYPIAMHFAKSAAANALVDGWKSVELCQAYILMSIYALPARRWEEDRSWLYTGLAIRIATDLNLHLLPRKKPTTEQQELEILNRTRIWIICFNLDKSNATQFGKPSTLEDYIVRHSLEWYKSSDYNHPYDVHTIAYSSLFRIVNQFHQRVFSDPDMPNGLNRSIDFRTLTLEYDQLLKNCRDEWEARFAQDSVHNDAACEFRVKLLPFYTNYARLVMFSFGFQKAFQRGFQADDEVFFTRSLESAKTVVNVLVESLVPTGYVRFAPDSYFVFATFASAFMLKLLRPECSRFISPGLEAEIYQVIERLINTIGSPQVAIDERHTPMLYSRFLARLLAKRGDGAAHGRMHQQGPPTQQPQASSSAPMYHLHLQTVPHSVAWNDEPTVTQTRFKDTADNQPTHQLAPYTFGANSGQPGDAMDFTFDSVSIDDLLEPMEAIENPLWMQTMMLPGFSWPTDEN